MNEDLSSGPTPHDFLAEVERLLSPAYAECFTDETRKVRNLLLVNSSVLVLFIFGVVEVGDKPVQVLTWLPLVIKLSTGIRWVLMALCAYFLLLFATRAFTEWNLWQLHNQAPMMAVQDLSSKTRSLSQARIHVLFTDFMAEHELWEKIIKLNQELNELRDNRIAEWKKECDLHPERIPELLQEPRDSPREKEKREQIHSLILQYTESENAHRSQVAVSEQQLKQLKTQAIYLKDAMAPVTKTLHIRFWFEMLFPILFAAFAILLGFVVHRAS